MATPNFANRTLYHGDNLPFLRGINSGTIHLIATDPPFNKGRDFHATLGQPRGGRQVRRQSRSGSPKRPAQSSPARRSPTP